MRVPVGGGDPVEIASGQTNPTVVVVDTSSIYRANLGDVGGNDGSIVKMPLAGGTPVSIASGLTGPGGLALDATSVYWTEMNAGTVMQAPLGGGNPQALAIGQNQPFAIAVSATSVFWLDSVAFFGCHHGSAPWNDHPRDDRHWSESALGDRARRDARLLDGRQRWHGDAVDELNRSGWLGRKRRCSAVRQSLHRIALGSCPHRGGKGNGAFFRVNSS